MGDKKNVTKGSTDTSGKKENLGRTLRSSGLFFVFLMTWVVYRMPQVFPHSLDTGVTLCITFYKEEGTDIFFWEKVSDWEEIQQSENPPNSSQESALEYGAIPLENERKDSILSSLQFYTYRRRLDTYVSKGNQEKLDEDWGRIAKLEVFFDHDAQNASSVWEMTLYQGGKTMISGNVYEMAQWELWAEELLGILYQ